MYNCRAMRSCLGYVWFSVCVTPCVIDHTVAYATVAVAFTILQVTLAFAQSLLRCLLGWYCVA